METIDIARLKSGEVNLGVRTCSEQELASVLICSSFIDLDHGRPVQGRRCRRRGQSHNDGQLHCTLPIRTLNAHA